MALEDLVGTAKYIDALNPAWPVDDDFLDEGDNHVRGIKNVLKNTFPNLSGAVTASQADINSAMPPGSIVSYAGAAAPAGWLLCDGASYSTGGAQARLFAAIGYTFGGSGANFNVPDLRGRVAVGKDNMGGTAAGRVTTAGSAIDGVTLGASGGVQNYALQTNQTPAHTHRTTSSAGAGDGSVLSAYTGGAYPSPWGNASGPAAVDTGGVNGTHGQAHQNMPPTLILNRLIRL